MKKLVLAAVSSAAMAVLCTASAATAATYRYTFTSYDGQLTDSGLLSVNNSHQATAITGTISGIVDETINGIAGNPNFPNPNLSSDGAFIYNNLYADASPYLDINGLLFTTVQNAGGYWNLWYESGSYSLWESTLGGGYAVAETGRLNIAPVPELSTWAMLGLGFAGLALAGYRRRPRSDAFGLA